MPSLKSLRAHMRTEHMLVNGYTIEPGANLTGANLRGADLTDANLTGANLTDAY